MRASRSSHKLDHESSHHLPTNRSHPPPSTGSVTDAPYRVLPQTDSPDTVNAFERLNFIHFQSFTSLLLPTRIFGASPAQRKNWINSGPMCFRCGTTGAIAQIWSRPLCLSLSDQMPVGSSNPSCSFLRELTGVTLGGFSDDRQHTSRTFPNPRRQIVR